MRGHKCAVPAGLASTAMAVICVVLLTSSGAVVAGETPGVTPVSLVTPTVTPSPTVRRSVTPSLPSAAPLDSTSIGAPNLRVMTFNVRVKIFLDMLTNSWDSRKALLIQTVREFDPDILGTQECLAEQSDYIRENLPEYGFVGVGRNDGVRRGEMVGIFYKNARFEQIETGNFWLSKRPEIAGSRGWDALFPRMVTWVKLRPRDGSAPFCVFNTHFDVLGSRARLESAKLMRSEILKIAPNMPCVITGDFNADGTPDSAPYKELLARTDGLMLFDAFRTLHAPAKDEGTLHNFHGGETGPRIDWIVTTPGFIPVAATILHKSGTNGKYPSDHFPVGAVFKVMPPLPTIAGFQQSPQG